MQMSSSIWFPYKEKDIDAIEQIQRRATKNIPLLAKIDYRERLIHPKLTTLHYRRIRGDTIEVYKLTHNIYYIKTSSITKLKEDSTSRHTPRGHIYMIPTQRCNRRLRANSFSHRITNIWNSLTDEVVNAPSLNAFKNRLAKHWSHQEVKYDYKAKLEVNNIRH